MFMSCWLRCCFTHKRLWLHISNSLGQLFFWKKEVILSSPHSSSGWMILRPFLCKELEAKYCWFVKRDFWRKNDCLLECFHEYMRKRCSEVGSIDVDGFEFWNVHFFTFWTEYLYSWSSKFIWESNWKNLMFLAKSSWAKPINLIHKLVVDLG